MLAANVLNIFVNELFLCTQFGHVESLWHLGLMPPDYRIKNNLMIKTVGNKKKKKCENI